MSKLATLSQLVLSQPSASLSQPPTTRVPITSKDKAPGLLRAFHVDECSSTMDLARQYSRRDGPFEDLGESELILLHENTTFCSDDPFLIWARGQTAGRGRRDRIWHSNPDDGLYFTFGFRPTLGHELISALPLVVGVISHSALQSLGVSTALKWPNDILAAAGSDYPGKKLGGVLVETSSEGGAISHVLIGVGINLRLTTEKAPELAHAIDIRALSGKDISAEVVLAALVQSLVSGLNLLTTVGTGYFYEEWKRHSYHQGRSISVTTQAGKTVEGIQLGLAADGSLRVQSPSGIVSEISSGEVG